MAEQTNNIGENLKKMVMDRKNIALRFINTLIFLIVLGVVTNIVWIVAVFQYLFLIVTRKSIQPLRRFSKNLTTYLKEVIDYILLTTNKKPFPFNEFPKSETEPEPLDIETAED